MDYLQNQHYFSNKRCDICKLPAIKFRITSTKTFMLCENQKCDLISLIQSEGKSE